MEPLTQLTLNSVEYNECLVIDWNYKDYNISVNSLGKIGTFIDYLIERFPERVQFVDKTTIYLPLEKGMAKALSTDEDGNVLWTELEAVTRHPPINHNGSSTLVKITTETGRTLTATRAKSFLVRKFNGKIKPKEGSKLAVGDLIPVTKQINKYTKLNDFIWVDKVNQIQNDVFFDKIVKIENFESEHPFVYDLTVEKTRNMTLINGINCRDTFHTAGTSAKNVSMGVPRFTELIDVSKHIKTPSMTLYLNSTMKPTEVIAQIEHTTLRNVIQKFVREPLPFETEPKRCIELKPELCIAKNISMERIAHNSPILHTSENSERWLMWFPHSVPLDMHLCGIENIEKIVMRQDNNDEWIMDTDGSNLIEVLSHPGIDFVRSYCNDIVETTEILGIEAGRQLLLQEIRNVISFDGNYVNYRHISILVDAMTYRGELTPMSRHGINRVADASVFHRASFEKTTNELANAGMYAERDPLDSITASVLMGKLAKTGTGIIDVINEIAFEAVNDEDSVSGFEIETNSEPESLKGFDVPDYDELYTETTTNYTYNYVPSSPKVVFKTYSGYVPSSPKFPRISFYIPSSP